MAFFGERVPWTDTRKKMDGDDKQYEWRQRIWTATTEKIVRDVAFFFGKSAMDGDKKEDGW